MDTTDDSTGARASNVSGSPRGGQGQAQGQSQGGSNLGGGANDRDGPQSGIPAPPVGAAAAAQQPKAISAAFIHKLYRYCSSTTVSSCLSNSRLTT